MPYELKFRYQSSKKETEYEQHKVKTEKEAICWCYEKLESIPDSNGIQEFDNYKYQPVTFEQAVDKLREKGYIYLTPDVEDGHGSACATKTPSEAYVWFQKCYIFGWVALLIVGYIPAFLLSFFMKFGDGTGNESGIAHFFGCASTIGLVIVLAAIGICLAMFL